MREKNGLIKKCSIAFLLFVFAILSTGICVQAASRNISVKNGDYQTVTISVGDTGKIEIDSGTLEISDYEFDVTTNSYGTGQVLTVASNGSYTILNSGSAYVEVYGYDKMYHQVFYAEILFNATINMNDVTLKQSSVVGYLMPTYDNAGKAAYSGANVTIDINSPTTIPNSTNIKVTSSNKKIKVTGKIFNNKINLSVSGSKAGKTTLKITFEGKTFSVKLQTKKVAISNTSLLLGKKKTKTLKITGYSGNIKWTSMNSKIASVSKKGKVTAKKYGTTVIIAKIGDQYLGCAVSVTTPALIKVCNRGEYIGSHWTYSQALRTREGYYDCSALVWKAYKQYTNIDFGSPNYPGTTRTESAWCRDHGRLLNGSFKTSMISKMQLRPGDIVFKSTSRSDKYNTTYHVEMFTGYRCIGVNSKGKPTVVCRWASRESGYEYGIYDGYIVARPLKY